MVAGDLNFRMNASTDHVLQLVDRLPAAAAYSKAWGAESGRGEGDAGFFKRDVEDGGADAAHDAVTAMAALASCDQLAPLQEGGVVFHDFAEAPLAFPPTFKLDTRRDPPANDE